MTKIERVGVSLEKELLWAFDKLISAQGYQSRSEAIRNLIRRQLSGDRLSNERAEAVAAVVLVYDHHATAIMQRLTELQHSHFLKTISSLHVHLGRHDCLEVIILRGKVGEINKMGEKLISIKGVKLGRINLLPTGGVDNEWVKML
jgi:CopG family nickel-responsive transcriptional regulator